MSKLKSRNFHEAFLIEELEATDQASNLMKTLLDNYIFPVAIFVLVYLWYEKYAFEESLYNYLIGLGLVVFAWAVALQRRQKRLERRFTKLTQLVIHMSREQAESAQSENDKES